MQPVDGVKLGVMCARRELPRFHRQAGRRQLLWEEGPAPDPWAGSLSPSNKDGFAIFIKCNGQCFCKENKATRINKGGESNEAVGEAGHDVAYSARCRQAGYRCKFGTCN